MLPTSTNVKTIVQTKVPANAEALLVFTTKGSKKVPDAEVFGAAAAKSAARLLESGIASGNAKQVVFDLLEIGGKLRRIHVAGLGPAESMTTETIRQSAGAIFRSFRKHKIANAVIVPPQSDKIPLAVGAEAVVTGILLAAFDYEEGKGAVAKADKEKADAARQSLNVTILADAANQKSIKDSVARAIAISDSQNFARTIASRPANNINPPALAKVAAQMAREVGLRCRVLDEKQMARLGMGGILAVGAGSIPTPPRMIVLEHKPAAVVKKSSGPLLLVGKAITFDTGGISIKPADKMGKMIYDKCGAMAVMGLMCAVAKLKLPIHVVGILSSAENAISSKAYRPGDILTMYNGVTVEVTNTDAEGRLVLGDALAWGIEQYKPSAVVDLATLTGGIVVALGGTMAGLMGTSDSLAAELQRAGDSAGEKMWRLPLGEDQREQIKSDMADIVNSAGREAHPLQGGAFLSYFVPAGDKLPWAHLDIAGVANIDKELPYYGKGATGWGVRTLVNWVEDRI